MERLGRKGGGRATGRATSCEGMEALEGGQSDRAMEAMERALNKMRAMEEQGRDGKSLRGGRESDRRGGQRGSERGPGQGGPGDEGDFPEGEGLLPGRGKSAIAEGRPDPAPARQSLRRRRRGRGAAGPQGRASTPTWSGAARSMPSRLQYMGVLGQYRKMMEESIAREQVPRDFQSQVKEYFQALDEK